MNRMIYTKTEQQIDDVLAYHDKQLSEISFPNSEQMDKRIEKSKELLEKLGYEMPSSYAKAATSISKKSVMVLPQWDELCRNAEKYTGTGHDLDELFTEEELKANSQAIRNLNFEYNSIHSLDSMDVAIAAAGGLLGALTDVLLVGIPNKTPDGLKAGPLSNYIRDYFDKRFPEEEMKKLANSKISKVPYDAQDNRHTTIDVKVLSAYYHSLGMILFWALFLA